MYRRDTGLVISLIAGAIIGVGYLTGLVLTRNYLSDPPRHPSKRGSQPKSKASGLLLDFLEALSENLDGVSAIALGIGVFGGVSCLLFALLNPLMQFEELTRAEIDRQLADGTLILRLTTAAFAGSLLWRSVINLLGKGESREFATETDGIPARLSDERRRVRDTTQSTIFVAALFTLWLLSARGVHTTATTFLAYVFAFFSDDWSIMSEYSRVLKGRLLRWHRWRIHIANALLLIPLAIIAWQEFRWWGILVWYFIVFYVVLARYGYSLFEWLPQPPAQAMGDAPPAAPRQ